MLEHMDEYIVEIIEDEALDCIGSQVEFDYDFKESELRFCVNSAFKYMSKRDGD